MSVVTAIRTGGNVYFGADSQASGDCGISTLQDSCSKIIKFDTTKGRLIIGLVGGYRILQIIQYSMTFPAVEFTDKDPLQWIVAKFVPRLRETLKEHGEITEEKPKMRSDMLMGWMGRLFILNDDFTIFESSTYYDAIGCGRPVAMGAFFALDQSGRVGEPESMLRFALEAAAAHDLHCGGPLTFLSSEA